MEIPIEICEMLVEAGGPLTACKLSMTCRYLHDIYNTRIDQVCCNSFGTAITFKGGRWLKYWNLTDYIIQLENGEYVGVDKLDQIQELLHPLRLTITSKATQNKLRVILYYDYGVFVSHPKCASYSCFNSGLFEEPPHKQNIISFTIGGHHVSLIIIMSYFGAKILDIKNH